jgi:hypothetical protein
MRTPDIRPYKGKFPQIAASAYIDPAAVVVGDVMIGEESSVWPMTVVRGDVHHIRIGKRTNIQDGCVLHVMKDEYPMVLGDQVTVGHSVTLHDSFARFDWDGFDYFERGGDWREFDYCGGDFDHRANRDSGWKSGDGFARQSEKRIDGGGLRIDWQICGAVFGVPGNLPRGSGRARGTD